MAGNLEPQDRYSASALMQLGGRDLSAVTDATSAPSIGDMTSVSAGGAGISAHADSGNMGGPTIGNAGIAWPLNIFDMSQAGNGPQ